MMSSIVFLLEASAPNTRSSPASGARPKSQLDGVLQKPLPPVPFQLMVAGVVRSSNISQLRWRRMNCDCRLNRRFWKSRANQRPQIIEFMVATSVEKYESVEQYAQPF